MVSSFLIFVYFYAIVGAVCSLFTIYMAIGLPFKTTKKSVLEQMKFFLKSEDFWPVIGISILVSLIWPWFLYKIIKER